MTKNKLLRYQMFTQLLTKQVRVRCIQ